MDARFILRRIVFWYLVAFFSIVTSLKLVYSWFKKRGNFFYTREHAKPKALEEFSEGFIQLTNVKLHYVEAGDKDKPLMVFVHGFPSFFYCWRFQLRRFQSDYHVIAIDMRGYNESDKPQGIQNYSVDKLVIDLAEVIVKFGSNAITVGHDWGAIVCWELALNKPELIQKLIILNVPEPRAFREVISSNYKQVMASWYMFMFQVPILAESTFSAEDYRLLGFVIKKGIKDPENFTEEDLECYKYAWSRPYAVTAAINYYRATASRILDGTSSATGLVKPKTLIIWGALDTALTVEGAHASLKYCEEAQLKILPTASHFVQEDEPQKVNEYIQEFLNSS